MQANIQETIVKKSMTMTEQITVEAFVNEQDQLKVSVGIPDTGKEAPPMDLVCVIDISASMGGRAACQTDGHTEYEDLGFSILDLVKHAVKTVVSVMRPQDRICIILFDDRIENPYPFTNMSDAMRKEILSFVGGIRNRGSTNIYDALMKGIDLIMERSKDEQNDAAIMFFTDGQPNCGKYKQKDQIVQNIKKYAVEKKFYYPIHTYAFGQYTNCTSDLMFQIASSFNGMFGYIQDAKTVGTIFINGISYILSTAASLMHMRVEIDGKAIEPIYKNKFYNGNLYLPGLRYGQTSDTVYDVKGILNKESTLKVGTVIVHNNKKEKPLISMVEFQKCSVADILDHQLRMKTINLFEQILSRFKTEGVENLKKEAEAFVDDLKKLEDPSEFVTALIDTVERQTVTMLEKVKYVEKWGEHQLRHLIRSLEMQVKGNFREQCLKDFGGQMFNDLADQADDIYNNMEPPTASLARQNQAAQAAQIQNAAQFAAKMNNFDDDDNDHGYYGGGCFAGHNLIKMADGSQKLVKDLVKGDKIATPNDEGATIKCVVRTTTFEGKTDMCLLEGSLLITPGHPVKLQNQWVYPRDVVKREVFDCEAFYNLVVDQCHVATVNGVELILLGHNYEEGILKHEYLGTQRVVNDLKKLPGFNEGLVHLQKNQTGKTVKAVMNMKPQALEAETQIA